MEIKGQIISFTDGLTVRTLAVLICLILIAAAAVFLAARLKRLYKTVNDNICEYRDILSRLELCDEELALADKHIEQLVLPSSSGNVNSDCAFPLYKTENGKKLHIKYNCCSAAKPVDIHSRLYCSNLSELLCKKCFDEYSASDSLWHSCYSDIIRVNEELVSIESNRARLLKKAADSHKKCSTVKVKLLTAFNKKGRKALLEANRKYAYICAVEAKHRFHRKKSR